MNEDWTLVAVSRTLRFVVLLAVLPSGLFAAKLSHKTWLYTVQTDALMNNWASHARRDPPLKRAFSACQV